MFCLRNQQRTFHHFRNLQWCPQCSFQPPKKQYLRRLDDWQVIERHNHKDDTHTHTRLRSFETCFVLWVLIATALAEVKMTSTSISSGGHLNCNLNCRTCWGDRMTCLCHLHIDSTWLMFWIVGWIWIFSALSIVMTIQTINNTTLNHSIRAVKIRTVLRQTNENWEELKMIWSGKEFQVNTPSSKGWHFGNVFNQGLGHVNFPYHLQYTLYTVSYTPWNS